MPSQTKIYFALLPAVTKRELPGKNKIRADTQASFPKMFSNRLQLWNFIGQRLVKLMEEDSKMLRYSPHRYRLSIQGPVLFHVAFFIEMSLFYEVFQVSLVSLRKN